MRFVQWSLSGCKSCEVVRLFVSCGKPQLRRIRCHVKKKHVRKKKHVCHDCTCLVHCAIMIWTDEQGSHEINRIIVKAVFKQQLLRSIFTSALSSCVIVSVVCLHSSALIHNCRCQCVLCMITTGSRGAFVCCYRNADVSRNADVARNADVVRNADAARNADLVRNADVAYT